MIINFTYDSSVASAPVGFTATLNNIASFFQSTFSDAVTINIAVGYGEVNGQALPSNALGESLTYLNSVTYTQIASALAADAKSTDDHSVVASLPATNPTGGAYWVASAEAKALQLPWAGNALDGAVGFSNIQSIFDFDNSNGVTAGQYDFFGVVAHEVTEVMGRQLLVGQTVGNVANGFEPMDLLHFAAAGTRTFSGGQAGYFSPDNGTTNLDNFNTNSGGDFGDWASTAGADAFLAFSTSGVVAPITQNDIRVMDALGWDVSSSVDTTAPLLSSTSPADNSTNVATGANLV
ncbi:MAG TPA: NF038122 family metalloprotease, partial [Micropepsaceae bacterium]|nr:NF038122 family metalloprotease [Micropepsaceae bacterium]